MIEETTGQPQDKSQTVKRALPAGVTRLGDRYRARIYLADGSRKHLGVYSTIALAAQAVAEGRTDNRRGDWVDPRRGEITLDRWMTMWMPNRERIRPPTLRKDWSRYNLHIKPYLGRLPLSRITVFQVQTWMAQLSDDGRRDPTISKAHALLKTALGPKGAIGDERRRSNPCSIAEAPKIDRREWTLLTRSQFEEIQEHVPDLYKPLTLIAAFGGLRWSEIAGLQRRHFNPFRGELKVERAITYMSGTFYVDVPKNRRSRVVPLPAHVTAALNEHVAVHDPNPQQPLFTSPTGAQLRQPHFVSRVWKPAARKAGYPDVRFHDLRHSCCSWLLEGGLTLAQVRDIAGHSSVTVTEIYLHTDRDALSAAVQRALG